MTVIIRALATLPVPAKAAMADRPTTMRAKYSAEWNSNATVARPGAKPISRMAPMVPPANDPMAAMVSALPALPWRAMG